MSADLVAFVRARLDEEERTAQDAADGAGPQWEARFTDPLNEHMGLAEAGSPFTFADGFLCVTFSAAEHAARHDPARTLRRIARDCATLDAYAEVADLDTENGAYDYPTGRAVGLGIAVRQMAARDDQHPDYQPRWTQGFTR